jgi:hypothetical protein
LPDDESTFAASSSSSSSDSLRWVSTSPSRFFRCEEVRVDDSEVHLRLLSHSRRLPTFPRRRLWGSRRRLQLLGHVQLLGPGGRRGGESRKARLRGRLAKLLMMTGMPWKNGRASSCIRARFREWQQQNVRRHISAAEDWRRGRRRPRNSWELT